jgi:AraC-like DNA-binding protein
MAEEQTRVVRHSSPLGEWENVSRLPAPALRSHVRSYQGYYENAPDRGLSRHTPTGEIPLIILFESPLRHHDPTGRQAPTDTMSFVAGMHDTYAETESVGPARGLQINLTPIGARMLFGVPMTELTGRIVPLEDLLGPDEPLLTERLFDAGEWETRFDLLDAMFTRAIGAAAPPSEAIAWAWHRLESTYGRASIGSIGNELGWSGKRIISEFREHIGLPPKTLGRIYRFNRAMKLISGGTPSRLADAALRSGYYDQSHLVRDFRAFAGCTPGEFLSRQWPDNGGMSGD